MKNSALYRSQKLAIAVKPCGHEVGIFVQMSVSIRWPKRSYPLVDGCGTVPRPANGGPRLGAVAIRVSASCVFPSRHPRHWAASK